MKLTRASAVGRSELAEHVQVAASFGHSTSQTASTDSCDQEKHVYCPGMDNAGCNSKAGGMFANQSIVQRSLTAAEWCQQAIRQAPMLAMATKQ